jgi:hypothetical protein
MNSGTYSERCCRSVLFAGSGVRRVENRVAFTAILFLLVAGLPWRLVPAETLAVQASHASGLDRHAVVKQDGVYALQPLGALPDERLAQTHLRAQIEQMRRRDPRPVPRARAAHRALGELVDGVCPVFCVRSG